MTDARNVNGAKPSRNSFTNPNGSQDLSGPVICMQWNRRLGLIFLFSGVFVGSLAAFIFGQILGGQFKGDSFLSSLMVNPVLFALPVSDCVLFYIGLAYLKNITTFSMSPFSNKFEIFSGPIPVFAKRYRAFNKSDISEVVITEEIVKSEQSVSTFYVVSAKTRAQDVFKIHSFGLSIDANTLKQWIERQLNIKGQKDQEQDPEAFSRKFG